MALPELMAFIAIIILRGLTKVPSMSDCWSANLGNPQIIATMSQNRFKDIVQHLRFDDRDTRSERTKTDKFAAISAVWSSFVTNCITTLVDTSPLLNSFSCQRLAAVSCTWQGPQSSQWGETVRERSFVQEPFLDKRRNGTTDNFFTLLSLAQPLLRRKTTILGTVNKIRWEIPQSSRQRNCNEFTTQVFSTTGAILTVYAPKRKKTVYVLSSMHSVVQTENTTKTKPNTITLYNTTKCSVDVMDQMVQEYTVRTGTRRWPVAVFYNMNDMAALNAHVLYQARTGRQDRRVDFLVELARELANSHVGAKKAKKEELLWQQPSTPSPGEKGHIPG
ncbi:piggyBac transposable element-derived protein 3-like isoform X2 [Xyrichtys novacula]|uniref:PiggyBac transposable element-derived protein 3-like isoform X2 n=1 Tax=Xyrichtys novacula TaxID=13765 RepID=A0AAV1F3Q1_XYRNO|nr:piggyBac transposable element-derived protein 3-like isoform X2 [Xyrichtys novacula]